MNLRSLRVRLAAWYFCTVTAIVALAAAGAWLAIRVALDRALDQGLRYRLNGLRQYLETGGPEARRDLTGSLHRLYQIGELYLVFDGDGTLIAQSYGLERHRVRQRPPDGVGPEIRFDTGGPRDFPLRLAWQRVTIDGRALILAAADPQPKYQGVLEAFTSVLLLAMPVILALGVLGGLWLGRRALAPVARITQDARTISEQNLSARLAVPDSRDELQQLSETLNAMLDRIEGSFARVRQFTADASHELRTPLTLIYTAAQFALRRERSAEDLADAMRKIRRESERTTALLDDLLALARGDAGKVPRLEPLDAAPLLRDAAEQGRTLGAAKGIEVRVDAGTPLPVRGDEPSLRRLLLILVDNAVKFTAAGEAVVVAGRADAAGVTVSVADTGPGIAAEDLEHVFERFWRADKVRARDAGGAGLGLSIARQIAGQHGGTLGAESEPGRGAVFTLRLPSGTG